MAFEGKIVEKLNQTSRHISAGDLINTFNRLMKMADSDEDRAQVMQRFRQRNTELMGLVVEVNRVEKDVIMENGSFEEQSKFEDEPEEYTEIAYGMLLGFLVLSETIDFAELLAKHDL